LTEVHDEQDLTMALECGADIIGINNRDLTTFEVNLEKTLALAPLVPAGCLVISESGVEGREDIERLKRCGLDAVLVGSALMRSGDVKAKARELVLAGSEGHDAR
jgi:indole-3-glycerol phosphate synthase